MIAYHVDSDRLLRPNMSILLSTPMLDKDNMLFWDDLFKDGASHFGFSLLESHSLNDEAQTISQLFNEFHFEHVRRHKFPEMPSRFQAFFTCKTLEDALSWLDILNSRRKQAKPVIWEIEIPDDSIELDASWRDILHTFGENDEECKQNASFNFFDSYRNSCKYWLGLKHPSSTSPGEIITRLHPSFSTIQILKAVEY